MQISLRLERETDYRETENVTREAFWDLYKPGCDEHLVLHKIRHVPAFVKELDHVACDGDRIVGNIVYSRAYVTDEKSRRHEVLCLGPVCALPEYQRKGVGSRLITHTIGIAGKIGYRGIILAGNPAYYSRFGFTEASRFGIANQEGKYVGYLLALELVENGMKGIHGRFREDDAFYNRKDELEEFERGFPFKEKHVTSTQLKME